MVPSDRRRSRKAAEGVSRSPRGTRREEGSGWNHEVMEGIRSSGPLSGGERGLGRVEETVDTQPQRKRVDDEGCRDEVAKGTPFRWEPWLRDVPPGPADREVSSLPEGVGNGEVRGGHPPGGNSGDEARE